MADFTILIDNRFEITSTDYDKIGGDAFLSDLRECLFRLEGAKPELATQCRKLQRLLA